VGRQISLPQHDFVLRNRIVVLGKTKSKSLRPVDACSRPMKQSRQKESCARHKQHAARLQIREDPGDLSLQGDELIGVQQRCGGD